MKRAAYLPSTDAVSTITATILLAYSLAHYIRLPQQAFTLQFAGVVVPITLNITTLTGLLVSGLVMGGMETLLRAHPVQPKRGTFINWLLPFLSAWVLGVTLNLLQDSRFWWVGVAAGGVVLTLVCVAEYVVVWPENPLYRWAASGLSLVAFGLYLALGIALHSAGIRLFWRVPALSAAATLASLRILDLRVQGRLLRWEVYIGALISAQSVAALHYLNLTPARYGLLLLAPLYALLSWSVARVEHAPRPWLEAIITAGLLVLLALVW
ncbi:MAG: hypothetical protein Fur0018_10910 [Anaerolineales bacterium]